MVTDLKFLVFANTPLGPNRCNEKLAQNIHPANGSLIAMKSAYSHGIFTYGNVHAIVYKTVPNGGQNGCLISHLIGIGSFSV